MNKINHYMQVTWHAFCFILAISVVLVVLMAAMQVSIVITGVVLVAGFISLLYEKSRVLLKGNK